MEVLVLMSGMISFPSFHYVEVRTSIFGLTSRNIVVGCIYSRSMRLFVKSLPIQTTGGYHDGSDQESRKPQLSLAGSFRLCCCEVRQRVPGGNDQVLTLSYPASRRTGAIPICKEQIIRSECMWRALKLRAATFYIASIVRESFPSRKKDSMSLLR